MTTLLDRHVKHIGLDNRVRLGENVSHALGIVQIGRIVVAHQNGIFGHKAALTHRFSPERHYCKTKPITTTIDISS